MRLGRAAQRLRGLTGRGGGDLEPGVFTDCGFFWLDLVYEDLLSVRRLVQLALQVLAPLFWTSGAIMAAQRGQKGDF